MAKAYRTRHDVSFPRVLSRSGEGDNLIEATEGTNYAAGSIVTHDSLPRHVQTRAESGGLEHVLEALNDDEAEEHAQYPASPPDAEIGVFVPEHEAEAHALLAAGHHVVPKDQVLEALSTGEEHAANYQQAVKDAGYDRRPVQEWLAEAGQQRVPDHVLTGAETPAGVPHNRGPESGNDRDEDEGDNEEEAPRARPRPPQQSVGPDAGTGD